MWEKAFFFNYSFVVCIPEYDVNHNNIYFNNKTELINKKCVKNFLRFTDIAI